MAWTGESIGSVTETMDELLYGDTVGAAESFGHDISGGHVISAGEDLVGGLWNDTGDILEGAVHGVEDLFGSTVTNDVKDAASDVGSFLDTAQQDIAQGANDAVTDVGDGAEDVVADDIGDLF